MWGDNSEGQLGLGKEEGTSTPRELPVGRRVTWVSCGYYHSAFVTGKHVSRDMRDLFLTGQKALVISNDNHFFSTALLQGMMDASHRTPLIINAFKYIVAINTF